MSIKTIRLPDNKDILDALCQVIDINTDRLIKLELILELDKPVIVKETRYPSEGEESKK